MAGIPQTIAPWIWVKVATGVVNGIITRLNTNVGYYQTFEKAGDPAPTTPTVGTIPDVAVKIFEESKEESIGATYLIDVYIMCANKNNNNSGEIRVDL